MTNTEFLIRADGVVKRRDITEYDVRLTEEALEPLSKNTTIKIKNMFMKEGFGGVTVVARRGTTFVTFPVLKLRLRCRFRLVASGRAKVLTPNFGSATDPELDLSWPVPDTIQLRFATECATDANLSFAAKSWLIAYDARKAAYVLPLGNLYDDASLCLGNYDAYGKTIMEVVEKSLEQFDKSPWNGDLFDSVRSDKCEKLIRFKPDTFEPMPVDEWVNLATKISTPIATLLVP
jgi:hypothetical protein